MSVKPIKDLPRQQKPGKTDCLIFQQAGGPTTVILWQDIVNCLKQELAPSLPPPTITNCICPDPICEGDTGVTCIVSGIDFQPGITVTANGLTVIAQTLQSPNTLQVVFDAPTGGSHTITVTNPDGKADQKTIDVLPIQNITPSWMNVTGNLTIGSGGSEITRDNTNGWNSHARSVQCLWKGSGFVEFTPVPSQRAIGMFGFSYNPTATPAYQDTNFVFYYSNSYISVRINNVNVMSSTQVYTPGDVLRIEIDAPNSQMLFKINGNVFHAISYSWGQPLYIDALPLWRNTQIQNISLTGFIN